MDGEALQPFPAIFGNRLARDFTPADLLPHLRAAGINGTILVQSLNDLIETIEYLTWLTRTISSKASSAGCRSMIPPPAGVH